MGMILKLFNFYIFANIHVALATFSLTKVSLLFVGNEQNEIPLFVFFSTIVAYNFIRLYRKSDIKSWFSNWIDKNKIAIFSLSFISLLGMCYLILGLRLKAIISLIPFFLMTFFYVIPIGRVFSSEKTLRTISGIKIFLIAICWAGVTVIFPFIHYDIAITTDMYILFLQRFLFVIIITIPFDLRDLSHDEDTLKTIPQLVGVAQAKRLGLILLMLFLGLEILINDLTQLRITFLIALISLFFLIRSTTNQSRYYSAFFVEGIPIVWLLLLLF